MKKLIIICNMLFILIFTTIATAQQIKPDFSGTRISPSVNITDLPDSPVVEITPSTDAIDAINSSAYKVTDLTTKTAAGNTVCVEGPDNACGFWSNLKQKCTSGVTGAAFCVAMGFVAVQVVEDLMGSDKSKKVADQTQCTGSYCANNNSGPNNFNFQHPTVTSGPNGLGPDGNKLLNNAQSNLKMLADKGYTYDPNTNTMNTPNGPVPPSILSSSDGLKKLGLSDAQIKSAEQALKGTKSPNIVGYDEGGAGGSRPRGGGYADGKPFDMVAYMRSLTQQQNNRGVAGLSVQSGTDHIGIWKDNIFQMVHLNYQIQQQTLDVSY